MEIADWLSRLGLAEHTETFKAQSIDAQLLPELTDAHLKELGLSLGHRLRLLRAIDDLRNGGPRPVMAVPTERRQVTVMFADLAGFTRLSARLDAEEVHLLLDRFFATVDGIVLDHGGAIDKHIGDCVMAVFGAPRAHGDDPERAVRAAIAAQAAMPALALELGQELGVHIGIACGEVVAGGTGSGPHQEYTVTGATVNLAARLANRAPAGATLISEAVHRAVGSRFGATPLPEMTLAGLDGPVRAWRITGVATTPADGGRALIGRKAELAQLATLLQACRDKSAGQLVHLRGEAGIGKTRLVEELARLASADGFAVHRALVLDFGASKGQDAVRALARSLLDLPAAADVASRLNAAERAVGGGLIDPQQLVHLHGLLDLPPPPELRGIYDAMDRAGRQEGARRTMATLIRRNSRRAPLLLVVEDVHWADSETLGQLAGMASAIDKCPVLLVLTSRIEGDPLDAAWRAQTLSAAPAIIDLAPLRQDEALDLASALVDATTRFAQACVARADGNPLFLEQLLRSAEDATGSAVPGSIQSVVLARIDLLAPRDRETLQAASVLGQRFDLEALQAVLGTVSSAEDELVRRSLLRPDGDGFLFAHALVRDGVYASLLQSRRRELHARAADWFTSRDASLRAEHLDQAADPRAPAAYLAAAEAEAASYRHDRARQLLERGRNLAQAPAERFALACQHGAVLRELGAVSEAVTAYQQASEVAVSANDRCRALIGLAACLRLVDRYDDGFRLLDEAEAIAAADGLDSDLARIHHLRGNLCFPLGQIERCAAEHAAALALARASSSAELEASALGGLGDAAYLRGRMRTARGHFADCVDLARKHGLARIEVANLPMVGHCYLYTAEADQALAYSAEAVDLAARIGHPRAEIIAQNAYSFLGLATGDLDLCERSGTRALALARQIGSQRFEAMGQMFLASMAHGRGRPADAERLLEEALALARASGLQFVGPQILAQIAVTTGDPERRTAALAECEALLAQGSISHNHFWAYHWAIEASLKAGAWDEVERYASALEAYTAAEPLPWSDVWTARGRALAAHGRRPGTPETVAALGRALDRRNTLRDARRPAGAGDGTRSGPSDHRRVAPSVDPAAPINSWRAASGPGPPGLRPAPPRSSAASWHTAW